MFTTQSLPVPIESRDPTVLISKDEEAPAQSAPRYACHRCGATSYRGLMARDERGMMRASGRHACTGCRLEFGSMAEWTTGTAEATESTPVL